MESNTKQSTIELHGREYKLPQQSVVVVCVDGFDPDYFSQGIKDGVLPTLAKWTQQGFHTTGLCTMPSVTNTNNVSIITGVPSAVHGVSGNYYLDKATGKEHMLQDDSTLWGSTILEQLADAGVRVAAVTAKDKLRRIINHGHSPAKGSICFSAQYADDCSMEEHGISNVTSWLGQPQPSQYSGELSIFVLDAGLKLLQEGRADFFYLTLSDYIQHKHAPGSPEANDFLGQLDERFGAMEKAGAVVAVTADHGMSGKTGADGKPNVLFVGDFIDSRWPDAGARVICPIADPFVKHHGALGGFVRVHLLNSTSPEVVQEMIAALQQHPLVEFALSGAEAAKKYEMPLEREGDIVVISKADSVVGAKAVDHDLSQLGGHGLRSHGGLSEQAVPLFMSMPLAEGRKEKQAWRNCDVFDLVLNN